MSWTATDPDDDGVTAEWERDDGHATIRLRERADGSWVARLDRLTQAPEGSLYVEERVETRADAETVIDEWRDAHGVPE